MPRALAEAETMVVPLAGPAATAAAPPSPADGFAAQTAGRESSPRRTAVLATALGVAGVLAISALAGTGGIGDERQEVLVPPSVSVPATPTAAPTTETVEDVDGRADKPERAGKPDKGRGNGRGKGKGQD
jgi:hypothetical protein